MDEKIIDVLEQYHQRMARERETFPRAAPAGSRSPLDDRMLAIDPESGQLLNILVRSLKQPVVLELGTSYGYSGIWLAEAARAVNGHLITMESAAHKAEYAKSMAMQAGLADHIDFMVGDALQLLGSVTRKIDFVFLDLWKDLYVPCLNAFAPMLNPGALIVADNMIRPGGPDLEAYAQAIRARPDMESILLPVGNGLEVSRYRP